ncbi:unnamed protein product [Sphagnum jensenii]|uniref:Uncharacterized protein n=2 Tax=Sphagnum TaxID=13804 RepID=A0ABP0W532_9BRYO
MSSTASVGKIQQIIKQPCLHQLAASCATANQNRTQQELPHLYEECIKRMSKRPCRQLQASEIRARKNSMLKSASLYGNHASCFETGIDWTVFQHKSTTQGIMSFTAENEHRSSPASECTRYWQQQRRRQVAGPPVFEWPSQELQAMVRDEPVGKEDSTGFGTGSVHSSWGDGTQKIGDDAADDDFIVSLAEIDQIGACEDVYN